MGACFIYTYITYMHNAVMVVQMITRYFGIAFWINTLFALERNDQTIAPSIHEQTNNPCNVLMPVHIRFISCYDTTPPQ